MPPDRIDDGRGEVEGSRSIIPSSGVLALPNGATILKEVGQTVSDLLQIESRRCPLAKKFKPQFLRLLFIDGKLREGTRSGLLPNCTTLAEEYEISTKTIQRDIDYLKWQLGAPIEYDAVRRGYCYTEDDFVLPALRITESDLFAICITEKVLVQYRNTPIYEKLKGIFSKLEAYLPDKITVHPSALDDRLSFFPEASTRIDPAIWEVAFRALRTSRTLDFRYKIPTFETAYDNRLDPYHAVGYRGEWYLIGRCHYKDALRVFGLSRIQDAAVSDDIFTVPANFDFQAQWHNSFGIITSDEQHEVAVRFTPDQAPYVKERDWHPTQSFEDHPDGSTIMTFNVPHLFEVKRWVLTWGKGVRVLEPTALVEMVRADLRGALEAYGSA